MSADILQDEKQRRPSYKLLTRRVIEEAIKSAKGPDAKLLSWDVRDFTKKGDNFICYVTRVSAKALIDGQEEEISFIAKLNPCRVSDILQSLVKQVHPREGLFFTKAALKLSRILEAIDHDPLRVPTCYFLCLEKGKEVILCEDLGTRGFKMGDVRQGMTLDHALLVVRELARLHSASYLLQTQNPEDTLQQKFPFMTDDLLDANSPLADTLFNFIRTQCEIAIFILSKVRGYEPAITWLKKNLNTMFDQHRKQVVDINEAFRVICHGDCWNNNILFRHDSSGKPVEVMLVDLQLCRVASLATDLNYFFYSSIPGDIRRKHLDLLLSTYYDTFQEVAKAGGLAVPFDREELRKEFHDKNVFGLVTGIVIGGLMLTSPDKLPDFETVTDDDIADVDGSFVQAAKQSFLQNPNEQSRYLSMYDEMLEFGIQ